MEETITLGIYELTNRRRKIIYPVDILTKVGTDSSPGTKGEAPIL